MGAFFICLHMRLKRYKQPLLHEQNGCRASEAATDLHRRAHPRCLRRLDSVTLRIQVIHDDIWLLFARRPIVCVASIWRTEIVLDSILSFGAGTDPAAWCPFRRPNNQCNTPIDI